MAPRSRRPAIGAIGAGLLVFQLLAFPGLTEEPDPSQVEFFEKEIRPLLVENCYECHDASSGKRKGGLDLSTAGGWRIGGDTGPAIVPGAPDESLLLTAVRYHDRDLQMPPRSPLGEGQVATLQRWIKIGAPDPRSDQPASPSRSSGMTLEEGREHWSFRPLQVTQPPAGAQPVDWFLGRVREAHGLPVAAETDPASWLRRVSFALTGLPPTLGQLESFLDDPSPEARRSLIEGLLGSEDYGIRWGRHWLDVARYADSNGLDENLAFANAWRYRDYVFRSFREDRPFDRFLVEQIAGDLLGEPTRESLVATGFLALGARVLAEPDREKLEMDVIDEQLDTIGKAFLGLTLGCARCHDHKFDPILQSDYYSLAAIFRNTRNFAESKTGSIHHWYEHEFATEAERERFDELDEDISEAKKAARKFKSDIQVELRGEARSRAVDYLVAALEFEEDATLDEIAGIASRFELHPRILHHTRRHLAVHRDSEVFASWWKFREADDAEGLRLFYEEAFGEAVLAFQKLQKENRKAKTLPDPGQEAFRSALFDKSGFLAVPAKPAHAFAEADLAEYRRLEEKARLLESRAPDRPAAMGATDREEISPTLPIHIRGSHRNLGDPVPRAIPAVFSETELAFPEDSSGRLELARWMASPGNPLTARVIANRVWRWHFGEGLVSTTENFGALGEEPSHPELLDWLANHLIESGWSIHALQRVILLSDAYAMESSAPDRASARKLSEIDPDNRYLTHFPVRRLEAEAIRDATLAVAGRLERFKGGKTIPLRNRQMVFNHTSKDHTRYEALHRTAFLPVVRNHVYDWLHLFDYPDPTTPTGDRSETVIAPQALLLMNSSLAIANAEAFASRVRREASTIGERIDHAWQLALSRPPTDEERSVAREFIAGTAEEADSWTLLCQGLLSSNSFVYLR